jgi:peptidoglycan hydrolase CwlO-like protein
MFRFTIRELVLLTAIVALAVAWFVDHRRTSALYRAADLKSKAARRNLEQAGAGIQQLNAQVTDLAARNEELQRQLENSGP